MKKTTWLALAFFILANFLVATKTTADENNLPILPLEKKSPKEKENKNYKEKEIIVRYKSKNKKEKALNEIKNKTGKEELSLEVKDEIDDNLNMALIKSETKSTKDLIEEFKKDDDVEFAEPNFKREFNFSPNDTYFPFQWSHYNSGQTVDGVTGAVDADMDSTEAWDIESGSATDTIVAIIDDGVEYNYSDLANNMWDGTNCVDDLGNTVIGGCPYHGWDYESIDSDPYGEKHGTFIASLIASEFNNASGIAGLSRYNNIKLMALKFDLTVFTEIQSINFAKNNGAKAINASFGGIDYSAAEKIAIESFDGIFATSSGNAGISNDSTPSYPCSYNSSNIICVGSSTQNDTVSSFSNYGASSVDIMAPGENMVGRYEKVFYIGDGTSFAAPLVAGTAALLYAHQPTASIGTIRAAILQSSDHKAAAATKIACGRRLNINNALQAIINNTIPAEICINILPVYRFWSDKNQGHFYTTNEEEKNLVINNYDDYIWRYEGVAFYSTSSGKPVYRFWSDKNQHHFYTTNEEEKNLVINNYDDYIWKYEGIAYYLPETSTKSIYRFWSDKNQSHFYTADEEEKNLVINNYDDYIWKYEGVAFYAY